MVSVELELDDALYLEHPSENEYMTSDRKPKTVQRKNSMDEIPVGITTSKAAQKLSEIESNAKFPHILLQTCFKIINIGIKEWLVVMQNNYNVDACKSPALLCYIAS